MLGHYWAFVGLTGYQGKWCFYTNFSLEGAMELEFSPTSATISFSYSPPHRVRKVVAGWEGWVSITLLTLTAKSINFFSPIKGNFFFSNSVTWMHMMQWLPFRLVSSSPSVALSTFSYFNIRLINMLISGPIIPQSLQL